MRNVKHLSDVVILGLPILVQAWMYFVFFRALWPKRRRLASFVAWGTAFAMAAVCASAVSVGFIQMVRDKAPGIWPNVRDFQTAVYLWLFASSPAFLIYLGYRALVKRVPLEHSPVRRRVLHAAGAVAVAAPFAVEAFGALVTRLNFQVREVDLPITGLHPDLEGLKLLQLSDVHLSRYLSERDFARMIDASNELRPNVAVMTGDLISNWGDPVDACLQQLKRVKADAPLLGCLGNHETYAGVENYVTEKAARLGMRFLRRQRQELRFGEGVLNIAGIDYQPFALRGEYLAQTGNLVRPGAANILLSHNPDVFTESPMQGWQATLSGHTHGGQVTVEILNQTLNVARFFTRYVSGLYRAADATCYVTRGIGTIGIPARLGATPEITLLRLRRA